MVAQLIYPLQCFAPFLVFYSIYIIIWGINDRYNSGSPGHHTFPPFVNLSHLPGSRHCHHLRLLDLHLSMGDQCHRKNEWEKKNTIGATEKYMSHESLIADDCWFSCMEGHEHRLENGYGSSLFTDFTIPSKLDGELNTKNRPTFRVLWVWTLTYPDLSPERAGARDSGTQFLLLCLDPFFRWAIWMQSGSRAASNLTHPHMEAQAGRWQRTHLKNNVTRISIVNLYHIISSIYVIYVIRYVC